MAQSGLAYATDPYDIERYRSLTALAAEILSSGSELPIEQVLGLFKGESGYATPKVDVRGAVFRNNRILMVRETSDGGWTLPGGWADVHDTPAEKSP